MIQRYRVHRTSVTNKKRIVCFSAEVQQSNCSCVQQWQVGVTTGIPEWWYRVVVVQAGGVGTEWWWWYRVMVVVQSGSGGTEWAQITRTYSVTTIFGWQSGRRWIKDQQGGGEEGGHWFKFQHARLSSTRALLLPAFLFQALLLTALPNSSL